MTTKEPVNTIVTSVREYTSIEHIPTEDSAFPVRDSFDQRLDASQLFSFFTADIIREEVTFTR